MGTGTDVAIESAGIALVKGDLRALVRARGSLSSVSVIGNALRLHKVRLG